MDIECSDVLTNFMHIVETLRVAMTVRSCQGNSSYVCACVSIPEESNQERHAGIFKV